MDCEAKFLSIAAATVLNFNNAGRKKEHKKTIDVFQNSLFHFVLCDLPDFGLQYVTGQDHKTDCHRSMTPQT
jgi:hypothetical protein